MRRPATTGRRVAFGDITRTAKNKAPPGKNDASRADAVKTPGRRTIRFEDASPAKNEVRQRTEEPAPSASTRAYLPGGGWIDDAEPVEGPCGPLHDNDELVRVLDSLHRPVIPQPPKWAVEDFGEPDDELLRRCGERLERELAAASPNRDAPFDQFDDGFLPPADAEPDLGGAFYDEELMGDCGDLLATPLSPLAPLAP